MENYIVTASKSDADIIVFPEMALQGYCSAYDPESATYRLAVDKAITKKGYYAKTLSEYAKKYDMYVIFGASEKFRHLKILMNLIKHITQHSVVVLTVQ